MTRSRIVKEFAKTAADYGRVFYQYQESLSLVKRQKRSLRNLQRWTKKPETRKVSAHALEMLMGEILQTRQRIWSDTKYTRYLQGQVASLEHALEIKTRQLVAAK